MLREALEYFARLEIETLNERLDAVLGKRLSRRQLVDEFAATCSASSASSAGAVAQYALLQEAARRPELEAVCREWSEAWELLTGLFDSLGSTDPDWRRRCSSRCSTGFSSDSWRRPTRRRARRPAAGAAAWFGRFGRSR